MFAKFWINLRYIFGFGFYVIGRDGGVMQRAKTVGEATQWACRGFMGESVDIYRYDGGNRFVWVASITCTRVY